MIEIQVSRQHNLYFFDRFSPAGVEPQQQRSEMSSYRLSLSTSIFKLLQINHEEFGKILID